MRNFLRVALIPLPFSTIWNGTDTTAEIQGTTTFIGLIVLLTGVILCILSCLIGLLVIPAWPIGLVLTAPFFTATNPAQFLHLPLIWLTLIPVLAITPLWLAGEVWYGWASSVREKRAMRKSGFPTSRVVGD